MNPKLALLQHVSYWNDVIGEPMVLELDWLNTDSASWKALQEEALVKKVTDGYVITLAGRDALDEWTAPLEGGR